MMKNFIMVEGKLALAVSRILTDAGHHAIEAPEGENGQGIVRLQGRLY